MAEGSDRYAPVALLVAAAVSLQPLWAQGNAKGVVPSGQTERAEAQLVQFDIHLQVEPGLGRELTADDFDLVVGGRAIEGFFLDQVCVVREPSPSDELKAGPDRRTTPSLMLLFDQRHLTMEGRAQAIELAKGLVERLVTGGVRASVVSSGPAFRIFSAFTTDPKTLIDALDALKRDLTAFDTYSITEDKRIDDVKMERDPYVKAAKIRMYAREEYLQTRSTRDDLLHAFDFFAGESVPRGIVYFADTMRERAGEHYYRLPGAALEALEGASQGLIPAAAGEIDAITRTATTRGVHLFTVGARGILEYNEGDHTLIGLALETGGESFVGAVSLDRVSRGIGARIACPSIVSFPPGDLPKDKPLTVEMFSRVPEVKITVQGRIEIMSDSALRIARLTGAFVSPDVSGRGPVHVALIPRSGDGASWQAGAQVRFESAAAHGVGVDVGATVSRGDKVLGQFSKSIATSGRPVPLVVEKAVSFSPGNVQITGVAHDGKRDEIASARFADDWPDPKASDAAIAPIAVLQSRPAAASRDDRLVDAPFIALDANESADSGQPISFRSVVCRGRDKASRLTVRRQIEGDLPGDFAPLVLEPGGEPCIPIVDKFEPKGASGIADYRIIVHTEKDIIADRRRPIRFGTRQGGPGVAATGMTECGSDIR